MKYDEKDELKEIVANKIIRKQILWIKKNWERIPDNFKQNLKPDRYSKAIKSLPEEKHFVVLLLDRQKPSVERSYDFDEERIGVNRDGKIIWGFDSGCSCPSPWVDNFPNCYKVNKTWKQFEVNLKDFDKDAIIECINKIRDIKNKIQKKKGMQK